MTKRVAFGFAAARKIVRASRARMKGKSNFERGWRAALDEVDWLLSVNINLSFKQENEENGPRADNQP